MKKETFEKIKQANPVADVKWVPIEKVVANDYNPNIVSSHELNLLAISILHDGYTQPVVVVYDKEKDIYVIVDGYHRYFVMKTNTKVQALTDSHLPITILKKDINDRMASTIRHNRARGKHTITGMSSLIFQMVENGWEDMKICNELGLEPDELLRLKHMTGVASLFKDKDYNKSWEEAYQIKERLSSQKVSSKSKKDKKVRSVGLGTAKKGIPKENKDENL